MSKSGVAFFIAKYVPQFLDQCSDQKESYLDDGEVHYIAERWALQLFLKSNKKSKETLFVLTHVVKKAFQWFGIWLIAWQKMRSEILSLKQYNLSNLSQLVHSFFNIISDQTKLFLQYTSWMWTSTWDAGTNFTCNNSWISTTATIHIGSHFATYSCRKWDKHCRKFIP